MKILFVNILLNFLLIICFTDDKSYVKFPIYTYHTAPPMHEPYETTKLPYYKYFHDNIIYTILELGNPSQKILSKLNFDEYPFYIYYNRCTIPSSFDLNISKTYIRTPFQHLLTNIYVFTSYVNDYLHLKYKEKQYNITYLFSPVNNGSFEEKIEKLPYTCAEIGLNMPKPDAKSYNYNFIRELKLTGAIKEYYLFFEYDNNNDDNGEMFIGIEPHKYNKNKYKANKLIEINTVQYNYNLYWQLRFNEIYFNIKDNNNESIKKLIEIVDVGLNYNINIFVAPVEYMYLIEKEFFNREDVNCTRNVLQNNFYNYHCASLGDIKKFPTIYLNHRALGHTFEITYKDAFREYNGEYRCLIWFDMKYRKNWIMGKPFLKKYFFSFNVDKKSIGFYGLLNDNKDTSENAQKLEAVYIIIIFILLILVGLLSFFFTKIYYNNKKSRKKKAYLLEDSSTMPIDDGKEEENKS